MNSKGHFYVSLGKSIARIGGCLLAMFTGDIMDLAIPFFFAEILGIAEELVDKR